MKSFLKYRFFKSSYSGVIFLYLLMEWGSYFSMYCSNYGLVSILVAFYIFLPFLLPKKHSVNSISYHIHRSIFMIVNDIYKRQAGIMYFYITLWLLMFSMILYLFKFSPLLGLFMVVIIHICKMVIYILLYKLSKQLKDYPDFHL